MYIYKIELKGWAYVRIDSWLNNAIEIEPDGRLERVPSIENLVNKFVDMGRIIGGTTPVIELGVTHYPKNADAPHEDDKIGLIMCYKEGTFLGTPYKHEWLGEPVKTAGVPLPDSHRQVPDSRPKIALDILKNIMSTHGEAVPKHELQAVVDALTTGINLKEAMRVQKLLGGVLIYDCDIPPVLFLLSILTPETYRESVDSLERGDLPECLAFLNSKLLLDTLHKVKRVSRAGLFLDLIKRWTPNQKRTAYEWAKQEIQAQSEGLELEAPDFLSGYVYHRY